MPTTVPHDRTNSVQPIIYPINMSFFRCFILSFILLALMIATPSNTFAENSSVEIPQNTQPDRSSSGWKCERGFQKRDHHCVAIAFPENAYLTGSNHGNGWKCSWGHKKINDACIAIKVPLNAFINAYGDKWKCHRGYRADRDTCIKIVVPENAFYVHMTYGPGWKCMRGYHAKKGTCVALKLPPNAHIDSSGHNWGCNKPYRKRADKCVAP